MLPSDFRRSAEDHEEDPRSHRIPHRDDSSIVVRRAVTSCGSAVSRDGHLHLVTDGRVSSGDLLFLVIRWLRGLCPDFGEKEGV